MKIIPIKRCCNCGFNEHGQEDRIPMQETYLGITIQTYIGTSFGGPMLYCMYDPKKDFRDNMRGRHWKGIQLIIWIAGNPMFDGEFEKQLNGFPKRCPLEDLP